MENTIEKFPDRHVTSKTLPSDGHRAACCSLQPRWQALRVSVHLRTPNMWTRRAHVAYGLGNSDKGGGNLSLGVVATRRDREHCINIGYNSVFPFLSELTTLCDITQEFPGMSSDN